MVVLRGLEFIRFHYVGLVRQRSLATEVKRTDEKPQTVRESEEKERPHHGERHHHHWPKIDLERALRDLLGSRPETRGTLAARSLFGKAMEGAQRELLRRVVEGDVARIREAVDGKMAELIAGASPDGEATTRLDEIKSSFDQALADAVAPYSEGEVMDIRGVVKGVKNAFKDLEHSLEAYFAERTLRTDGEGREIRFDAAEIRVEVPQGEVDITSVKIEFVPTPTQKIGSEVDGEQFLRDIKHTFKHSFKALKHDLKAARKVLKWVRHFDEHEMEGKHESHHLHGRHKDEWKMFEAFLGILKEKLADLYRAQQEEGSDQAMPTHRQINLAA